MFLSKTTKLLLLITTTSLIILSGVFLIAGSGNNNETGTNEPTGEEKVKEVNQPDLEEVIDDKEITNPDNQPTEPLTKQPNQEPVSTNKPTTEDQTITELDTSNWKTYTNEEFGFSFKYPGGWYVNDYNRKNIVHLSSKPFPEEIPLEPVFDGLFSFSNSNSLDDFEDSNLKLIEKKIINGLHVVAYAYASDTLLNKDNRDVRLFIITVKPGYYVFYQIFKDSVMAEKVVETISAN